MVRNSFLVFSCLLILFPIPTALAIPAKHLGCVREEPGLPKDFLAEYLRHDAMKDAKPIISDNQVFGISTMVPNARVVKYDLRKVSNILVLLVEFADAEGVGPLHNQLPPPNPEKNNTDYWVPDFSGLGGGS